MASLQKTYSGDLSTSIAKQLWIARNIAAAAKQDAVKVAKGYGVDPMLRPGEFLGHALGARATGWLPRRFQHQVPNVTMGDPSYIARGQSSTALYGQSSPINAMSSIVPTPGSALVAPGPRLSAGQIARLDPVAKARMIQERMGLPVVSAESGFIPKDRNNDIFGLRGTRKEIQVKEGKLGKFLEAVALSLSSSFNSINKKLDESSEGINATKDGIDTTYKKLEQHSDSLESKLDDIIEALKSSNKQNEERRDRREAETKIAQQKESVDLSNTNRILMQDMDRQEIRDLQRENIEDQVRDDQAGDEQLSLPINDGEDGEGFARGGIASGPDSGYLAVLHGDEAIVPLDNNFTQGQPSAVGDQPVSQMPMMAERGIPAGDNPSTMKPSFNNNINITTPIAGSSSDTEALSKAIQLPAKAAGIVTLGLMGNAMKHGNLPPGVVAHMKSISAPIASTFGISDVMSSDLAEKSEGQVASNQRRQNVLAAKRGREGRERGILGQIKEFLFGTGGGNVSYRGGTGGNTYVNNRSTGTGGGYGVGGWPFGGGKPSDAIDKLRYKSDHPLGTAQPNPFEPGTLLYNNFEKLRQYDMMGMEISSSGGDSQFFTKNVSYENAFDYKKFESPQYGLRTSEIAYNMSMDDEISNTIEGLSDADSQVIVNNNTNKSNTGRQMEQSAIATRGNPLKEGTYLSPYSV